jgi:hypothetical protein
MREFYVSQTRIRQFWNPDIFNNREYWANLSKKEMQSLIMLEYMKLMLGKTSEDEVAELFLN